ncbi:MAG: hypothetical protein PHI42_06725 [Paludibacteraceae bacterium]|nr:hypothetical protein [Paludibacteraceae bacterium]
MDDKSQKKKVLLIEPNYSNKFPPVGLMKIATYYRNLKNWEVVFYKGDLKMFVIERIVDKLVDDLNDCDTSNTSWHIYKDILTEYVRTRKNIVLDHLPIKQSDVCLLLTNLILAAKDKYWKGTWKTEPEWDRVGVTTLFTFYWQVTVDTINFAKDLVKDPKNLMVGGVLASIQPKELSEQTNLPIHKYGQAGGIHIGILRPGDLDEGDTQNIDELELDYSILDEIDYRYPMANSYYRYTTRGCVNKCPFCAVPTLEPIYQDYIPLKSRIDRINGQYGEQKDLLLMDNNVLASKDYEKIINEIIDCGFAKGAKFKQPNMLEIAIRNLNNEVNDRAYIRKSWRLINEFYESLKGENSYTVYCIREKYHIDKFLTSTKENLIAAYDEIKPIYEKYHQPGLGKLRFVDFNQGLDARLFTPEKAELLGKTAIRPVRIAFDNIKTEKKYVEAIKMCVKADIKDFSNYLLYNFDDRPDDLYKRLRINVDLCEKLSEEVGHAVSIYSFPMKFHPIRKTDEMDKDYSHNRDYIGKHWNRKFIRAIQAVLNSTKGKIGRGTSFFEKAFGRNIEEYHQLLYMPETMIIYRFFFEWLGDKEGIEKSKEILGRDFYKSSTQAWWTLFQDCEQTLSADEWAIVKQVIHNNDFENTSAKFSNPKIIELLAYYINYRKDVVESGTDLYRLKLEYDKKPTLEAKRHGKGRNTQIPKS